MTGSPDDSTRPASRVRLLVLVALCALSAILYLDRICISQAQKPIQDELGLSKTESSYFMMAFSLAYALFEVHTGHWGDRIGSRRVLTRISIWWSVFTALTGACTGLWSLIVVRFLFGAGEAGAFPNCARVLARWFPDHERGRAHGVMLTASRLGGVAAPIISAVLIEWYGWRWTFAILGSVGVFWAAAFWYWFRDNPADHPDVNAAELAIIGDRLSQSDHHDIPWRAVLTNRSIWLLSLIMICASFDAYVYFSWFATYLQEGRGVSNLDAGYMTSMVLAGAASGTMVGGLISDWFVRPRGKGARRVVGAASFALGAGCLVVSLMWESPWLMALCAALSCMAAQSTQPLWWASITAISGRHVGALFGLTNSMGFFGAAGSQYFVGAFVEWRKPVVGQLSELPVLTARELWDPIFLVMAGVQLFAALCWALFDEKVVEGPESSGAPTPVEE